MNSAKKIYDIESISNPFIQSCCFHLNCSLLCEKFNYISFPNVLSSVEVIDITNENYFNDITQNKNNTHTHNSSESAPQEKDRKPEIQLLLSNKTTRKARQKASHVKKEQRKEVSPVRITRAKMKRIVEKDDALKNFVYFTLKDDKQFTHN